MSNESAVVAQRNLRPYNWLIELWSIGMATLHVRNVPDELYERIRRRAAQENRSLSAEVVALLDQVTQRDPDATTALFDRIRRRRHRIQRESGVFLSSVELLREDRRLLPPTQSTLRPHINFLRYHRERIFKG